MNKDTFIVRFLIILLCGIAGVIAGLVIMGLAVIVSWLIGVPQEYWQLITLCWMGFLCLFTMGVHAYLQGKTNE